MKRIYLFLMASILSITAMAQADPDAFITTWNVTGTTEADLSITIPTTGVGYNYSVDWGDGTIESNFTGDAVHTYTTAGTYTVMVAGSFPRINFKLSPQSNSNKIISVDQWGIQQWSSMENAFFGCQNLKINTTDVPDLTNVTSTAFMFRGATSFSTEDISNWVTTNVTDMSGMFSYAQSFNSDISGWDVSNVISMESMFNPAPAFNQNISGWDVSNVTNMFRMFSGARSFNQNISDWDVKKVIKMDEMFFASDNFNQDISGWDVSKVTSMSLMFYRAYAFNQDLGGWNIASITNMGRMLEASAMSTVNYDNTLNGWAQLPGVPTGVILGSPSFSQGISYCDATGRDILINDKSWSITGDNQVCAHTITFNALANKTLGDANFNLSASSSLGLTVSYTSSNESVATITGNEITIVGAGTTTITASQAGNTDYNAAADVTRTLTVNHKPFITTWKTTTDGESITIPTTGGGYNYDVDWGDGNISTNQTGNSTHIYSTAGTHTISITGTFPRIFFDFSVVSRENILSVEQWGTQQWSSMEQAFYQCNNLKINATDIPDLTNVTNMSNMFNGINSINQDISGWDVSKATDMNRMFVNIYSFNQDISGWDVSNVTNMSFMLAFASSFNQDLGSWDVGKVSNMENMFYNNQMSIVNYENTLNGWAALPILQSNVSLSAADLKYCDETGRNKLINDFGWTITEDIKYCPQTITFNALANVVFGDANFTLSATSDSGLDVTYTSSDISVATVTGNEVTVVGGGTTTITASQAGNANYNAAADVMQDLTVEKANQNIIFEALDNVAFGDPDFSLTVTTDSGLEISYTSSNTAVATVTGNEVTIVGAGTATISANQAGNDNYNAATAVTQELTVEKANQVITFEALDNVTFGDPDFSLTATTDSGLEISYTSSNTAVATVTGSEVTIAGAGTTTITANQAGNDNYNSATAITQELIVEMVTSSRKDQTFLVNLYPNPTSNVLHIKYPEAISIIQLFDAQGRRIETINIKNREAKIETTRYPVGLYFIQIDGLNEMHRFIKQ